MALSKTAIALKKAFFDERRKITGRSDRRLGSRYTGEEPWNRGGRMCDSVLADPYEFTSVLAERVARGGATTTFFPDVVLGKNAARLYLMSKGFKDVPMLDFDSDGALLPKHKELIMAGPGEDGSRTTVYGDETDWVDLVRYQLKNAFTYMRRARKMYPDKTDADIILDSAAFLMDDHLKFVVGRKHSSVFLATKNAARDYFVSYPQYLRSMEKLGRLNDVRVIRFALNIK